jgi:hypothetical protein
VGRIKTVSDTIRRYRPAPLEVLEIAVWDEGTEQD